MILQATAYVSPASPSTFKLGNNLRYQFSSFLLLSIELRYGVFQSCFYLVLSRSLQVRSRLYPAFLPADKTTVGLLCLCSILTNPVAASSVFTDKDGSFTFALNIPQNSNDLYFQLKSPSDATWIAVGTGSEMQDSQMFMAYNSADGNSK